MERSMTVAELDEKATKSLDYNATIMRQCDRLNKAGTDGEQGFMRGVEILIANLAFHSKNDGQFKKDIDDIDKQSVELLNGAALKNPDKQPTPEQAEAVAWSRAINKLAACERLMGRAGLLGERQIEFTEE